MYAILMHYDNDMLSRQILLFEFIGVIKFKRQVYVSLRVGSKKTSFIISSNYL